MGFDVGVVVALGVFFVFLVVAAIERFFATRLGYLMVGAAAVYITTALLVRGVTRSSAGDLITAFAFALIASATLLRAFIGAKRK